MQETAGNRPLRSAQSADQPLVTRFGGIPLRQQGTAVIADRLPVPVTGPKELTIRLLRRRCEWCEQRAQVEIHQVRKLADLDQPGQPQPPWAQLMARMRRKTLVVCHTCHQVIHAGRQPAAHTQELLESHVPGNWPAWFGPGAAGKGPAATAGTSPAAYRCSCRKRALPLIIVSMGPKHLTTLKADSPAHLEHQAGGSQRISADRGPCASRCTPHCACPRSLGYEHYNARLRCLVMSLVAALAWADAGCGVLPGLRRLCCSVTSPSVSFTDPLTSQGPATAPKAAGP